MNRNTLTNYGVRKNPARELRRDETDAEKKLWSRLRGRRLDGLKFRRQFPLGPFFADFCALETKLIIEVDGGQPAVQRDKDGSRTESLTKQGFRVLRFWNNEVLGSIDAVCEEVLKASPRPSP